MLRRYPGNPKVMLRASDMLVRAARAERYVTGSAGDVNVERLREVFEQLDGQLGPVDEKGSE